MRGLLWLLPLVFPMVLAHRAVPERPEAYQAEARLFALDNRPDQSRLVALDLPGGGVVAELSLPPGG